MKSIERGRGNFSSSKFHNLTKSNRSSRSIEKINNKLDYSSMKQNLKGSESIVISSAVASPKQKNFVIPKVNSYSKKKQILISKLINESLYFNKKIK